MCAFMIKVGKGGEPDPPMKQGTPDTSGLSRLHDTRDVLSHTIAGNYTGMTDDTIQSNYKLLASRVGEKAAQKLMTKAFIFNQTNKGSDKLARLQQFYDMPDDDIEVSEILKQTKGLGQGVVPGLRQSHLYAMDADNPELMASRPVAKTYIRIKK